MLLHTTHQILQIRDKRDEIWTLRCSYGVHKKKMKVWILSAPPPPPPSPPPLNFLIQFNPNQNLKLNHDKNLKPNRKQNSQHMLWLWSVFCKLCHLTKGICRESLCQISESNYCVSNFGICQIFRSKKFKDPKILRRNSPLIWHPSVAKIWMFINFRKREWFLTH